jgi:inner membrane protein
VELKIIPGDSIQKRDIKRDFPWLDKTVQQVKDIERFRRFSGDYLAVDPVNKSIIIDMRYSLLPNTIKQVWGIKLTPYDSIKNNINTHVEYIIDNKMNKNIRDEFMKMLF